MGNKIYVLVVNRFDKIERFEFKDRLYAELFSMLWESMDFPTQIIEVKKKRNRKKTKYECLICDWTQTLEDSFIPQDNKEVKE